MTDEFVNFGNLADSDKAAASHATDFEAPLYNIWKQQEKTKGAKHFGNSEVRWLGAWRGISPRPAASRLPSVRAPISSSAMAPTPAA
jgi:hypothetical protein